jgi:hypothetical protein
MHQLPDNGHNTGSLRTTGLDREQGSRRKNRRYPAVVLRTMRAPSGGPSLRTRAIALLTALGLLVGTAPLLIPIIRWVFSGVM